MKNIRLFTIHFVCLAIVILMSGCANTVYFASSERVSITLEAKTDDPVAPVQGNIGAKLRTILVTPKKDSNSDGEAYSVISDFEFNKEKPKTGETFGRATVRSAFITGKAASDLDATKTAQVMKAIAVKAKDAVKKEDCQIDMIVSHLTVNGTFNATNWQKLVDDTAAKYSVVNDVAATLKSKQDAGSVKQELQDLDPTIEPLFREAGLNGCGN